MIKNILFDADDTLWRSNEQYNIAYKAIQKAWGGNGFNEYEKKELEAMTRTDIGPPQVILAIFSMVAEKKEVMPSDQKLMKDISQVFYNFHNEPIPDAESALQKLQPHYNMMIVTKGGLFEQERKINASGFLPYFNMGYEVMVRKDAEEYCTKIFEKNDLLADETVMVGNSIKSDILPAIACGAYAIHIPYHTTWSQEVAKEPTDHPRYYKAEFISQVPEIVQKINDDLQNKLKSAHSLKL